MAKRIPDEIIEKVRVRADIVDLISEYLPLKKRGKNYFALCPFHPEKTPSFCVNPERQIYYCFGCGTGGNVFSFLMEYEKLSFLEAVRFLARRTGTTLPAVRGDPTERAENDTLYQANAFAADYYHQTLLQSRQGQRARDYLKARGFSAGIVDRFLLGYAPPGWDNLIQAAKRRSISTEALLKAGLVLVRKGGNGHYDRFRDRIIFPIFNPSGKVVGFGGRILADDGARPKYVNSPETPIYRKGQTLYGLPQARYAIRSSGIAIVVEGYTDLLSLSQLKVENVVATLGTALTLDQARLLARYTGKVLIVYDADTAGTDAAFRGMGVLLENGLEVKIVTLPSGTDPDGFVQERGQEEFRELLSHAVSFVDFILKLVGQQADLSTVEGMTRAVNTVVNTLEKIKDGVKRRLWIKRISETLSIEEEVILYSLEQARKKKRSVDARLVEDHFQRQKINPAEMELLRLMIGDRETIRVVKDRLGPEDFEDNGVKEIVRLLFRVVEEGKPLEPPLLIDLVVNPTAKRLISQLAMEPDHSGNRGKLLNDCIISIKKNRIDQELKRIQEELKMAQKGGDELAVSELADQYRRLIQARESLKNRGVLAPYNF